jgi:hypothetical protein
MTLLWHRIAAWSEPDEDDWRSARPNKFSKDPHKVYGQINHVDEYFQGHATRPTPWREQSRSTKLQDYDHEAVKKVLREKPVLEDVDPRILKSSQPSITRAGVSHYLSDGDHAKTGRTFADHGNVGNAHPVVYVHDNGDHVLLSGHHRAAAALFEGRPLRARIVRGGRPPR